ncbi:MAG: YbaK/EbsC family protein [Sphingobium sp.]|uniref:YbaK/EbsC family protein n=1 Tax=Sphingobium sp. TaxID=1912891 RepID=UPI0029A294E8|nr:YbaK/EbsC family protein [Sphingobium sp.]MDX3910681.1 YbaK/EbsC family protein [Sphingobium sp.]
MSIEAVRKFLERKAPHIEIIEMDTITATVAEAAQAHGVRPAQIAKTLSLSAGGPPFVLVTSGNAKLDNKKAKHAFGAKIRMLRREEVEAATGHPIGGVCPFGLPSAVRVYCDVSLKSMDEVLPAAGTVNAAIRISPSCMAAITGATWVDVCSPLRDDEARLSSISGGQS